MLGSGIHYLIYPGQMKTIFWVDIIEVSIIDTTSLFSFFFWDHNHVCQLIGILNFSDKPNCQQLVYFGLIDLLFIRMEASDFLSNRL